MPNSSRPQGFVIGTVLLAMFLAAAPAPAQLDQLLAYDSGKPPEVKAVADRFTPREGFVALYMAAPGTKRIATYPSDHPMDADIIRVDRSAWLAEQLGLAAP